MNIVIVSIILFIVFGRNINTILPSSISKYIDLIRDGNSGLDTGSVLIIIATGLMFVINIIYSIFA